MVEKYKRIEDILTDDTIISTNRVHALHQFEYTFNQFFPYNYYCTHLGNISKEQYNKCYNEALIAAIKTLKKYY
jgi:hypothetical protein